MKAIPYTTRDGTPQVKPACTEEELSAGGGFCLACGNEQTAEPDARKHQCEACGRPKVYGLEELLMMGLLQLEC